MLTRTVFPHPAPRRARPRILPVFTPRAGCVGRCLFCAQEEQSGHSPLPLPRVLGELEDKLEAAGSGPPVEIAFYGGTFTALPLEWMERFLLAAARARRAGVVCAVRCSTRPDALPPGLLRHLAALGLDSVELGVQTFDDAVLETARRWHTGADALKACRDVREAGMGLTVQLLPGLPGHTPPGLARDVDFCLRAMPAAVRLHPCLVLAGTGLEELWRAGRFEPWALPATVEALALAVDRLWGADIAVSRIGLAPEPSLERAVLAGPRHPALGTMVRARAVLAEVARRLDGRLAVRLEAPQRVSGELFGHARELERAYESLGLARDRIAFADTGTFTLDTDDAM